MVNSSYLYTISKVRLADLLYNVYISDPEAFTYIVNYELNNWDRFNIVNLFRSVNPVITYETIRNALVS